jgi:pantetheine-phosphate adenylyltransferase
VEYEIVPLNDVYGPTVVDRDIQGLVVSKETLSGAAAGWLFHLRSVLSILTSVSRAVDRKRRELGFPTLETFVIEVISAKDVALDSDDPELLKKTKISSTFIREWISDRQRDQTS